MLKNLFNWTKNNKVATLIIFGLLLVLVVKESPKYWYMWQNNREMLKYNSSYGTDASYPVGDGMGGYGGMELAPASMPYYPVPVATPRLDVENRKVITEASMSLQVENVNSTVESVKSRVDQLGGYVVNIYISRPEFSESATVSVRVPSNQVESFLAFARENSVKVVSENVSGSDITDQYLDLDTKLAQLEKEKAMLEAILARATTVEEIMQVRPYISQIQAEIDSLKGQTNYFDKASESSLVTLYLSTDELSLPYTPEEAWRPQAVFKNAVRSMLATLQDAGTGLIWLGVYSILIVPTLAVIWIIYMVKRRGRRV